MDFVLTTTGVKINGTLRPEILKFTLVKDDTEADHFRRINYHSLHSLRPPPKVQNVARYSTSHTIPILLGCSPSLLTYREPIKSCDIYVYIKLYKKIYDF